MDWIQDYLQELDKYGTVAIVGNADLAKNITNHLIKRQFKLLVNENLLPVVPIGTARGDKTRGRYQPPVAGTFTESRDLLIKLIQLIPDGNARDYDLIINYIDYISEYDRKLVFACEQLGIKYLIVSANGSPYRLMHQYLPRQNLVKINTTKKPKLANINLKVEDILKRNNVGNKPQKVLVIVSSSSVTSQVVKKLKKSSNFVIENGPEIGIGSVLDPRTIIVSDRLTDRLISIVYNMVIVYPNVRKEQDFGLTSDIPRSQPEIDIYASLMDKNGIMYILSDNIKNSISKYRSKSIVLPEIYDCLLIILIYNRELELLSNRDDQYLDVLISIGAINRNNLLTNIGFEINRYGREVFSSLFFYYWMTDYKNLELIYPGIVFTSYLENLQNSTTLINLDLFLDIWIELSEEILEEHGLSSPLVEKWIRDNYPRLWPTLSHIIESIKLKMNKYIVNDIVLFSKEGAWLRILPIITRVYSPFRAVLTEDGWYLPGFDMNILIDDKLIDNEKDVTECIVIKRFLAADSLKALFVLPSSSPEDNDNDINEILEKMRDLPVDFFDNYVAEEEELTPIELPFYSPIASVDTED